MWQGARAREREEHAVLMVREHLTERSEATLLAPDGDGGVGEG